MKWNKPKMTINIFVGEAITASGTRTVVIKDGVLGIAEATQNTDIYGSEEAFPETWNNLFW